MNVAYISNREDSEKILKYDYQLGPIEEKAKAELDKKIVKRKACYIKRDGRYLGVYGSKLGPVLFVNKDTYLFNDKEWFVTLEKDRGENIFSIMGKTGVLYQIAYHAPNIDELDPYSDELSVDFYAWLCSKKNDSEFIEMWSE